MNKEDKWIAYHATRLNLIQYIDAHLKSIAEVNVYKNGSLKNVPLNTSGDHALTNEMMGYDLIIKLKEKLTEEEEENPDVEPDYDAKTSQEMADEQREIYRTLK